MSHRLILVTGLVFSLAAPSEGNAQLVRVGGFGGVSVRAPFVAVDVLPFRGGTRVRAPFTAVNTGLYGYGYAPYPVYRYRPGYYVDQYAIVDPVYQPQPLYVGPEYALPVSPVPAIADPGYASPVSNVSIDQQLRASAARLQQNLSLRRDDGDIWIDYLEPDRIISVIDRGDSPEQLRPLLNNYVGVTGNGSLSSIWSSDAFRETYRLLDRFVSAAREPNTNSAPEQSEPNDLGSSILEPGDGAATDAVPARPIGPAEQDGKDRQPASGDQGDEVRGESEFDALPAPVPDFQ